MKEEDLEKIEKDEIMAKARSFDDKALADIYRRYYPQLLKFMHYRVGAEKAEDLTSEVFLKVLRSIDKQNGNFEAWLYKIARNVIIDKARYTGSRPEVPMEDYVMDNITEKHSVHNKINDAMDIQYALSKVSDDHREFLILKFIQGLDNKKISEITGKSIGALRALQFRALKSIGEVGQLIIDN